MSGSHAMSSVFVGEFNPLKVTGVTVRWEVENIWNLSFEGVSSDAFLLSDHIFHLHMRRYELGMALYLCRNDNVPVSMTLLCRVHVVDQVGRERLLGEKEASVERGKEFVLLQSLMISDLEAGKAEFLAGDRLTISCSIASSYRVSIARQQTVGGQRIISRFETLSSDLENFFKAQIGTDVLLRAENTDFPVHRTVLSARSPGLLASVGFDSETPVTKAIEIPEVPAPVLADILYYVYTGKIRDLTPERAARMFAAASRFSLGELKDVCLGFLQANMTEDNVFEAAALAHENGDLLALKEEVEQFIMANVPAILHSEKWKRFCSERYKFANEILTDVLLRMQTKREEES